MRTIAGALARAPSALEAAGAEVAALAPIVPAAAAMAAPAAATAAGDGTGMPGDVLGAVRTSSVMYSR